MDIMQISQAASDAITIKAQLAALDARRVRPLADVALGNGNVADEQGKTPVQRLTEIEAEAQPLREELAGIEAP